MNFDFPDPTPGTPLRDYITADYIRQLHAVIRFLLAEKTVGGGPGVTTTQFGGKTTIKARRISPGTGGGPPVTATHQLILGENGEWLDENNHVMDLLEFTVCIDGVETPFLFPVIPLT